MENATIPAAAGDLEELYAERDRHTKKRAALRNRVREIISEKMHSPLFLIVAIMMTGIAVLSLLSVVLALVQGGGAASFLGGLIVNVPATICAIVSAVASWKMYGARCISVQTQGDEFLGVVMPAWLEDQGVAGLTVTAMGRRSGMALIMNSTNRI